jgi:ssDNA-binding Zn-finger/Zn-ribbon topoisomerase 1
MTHILSLGAVNKQTGEYVYPKIANKKDEYICPECNKDLILVQGEIRVHHFRHKDSIHPCHHYSKPTESQIHKDAKMLMKTLLENKTHIQFIRECVSCKISAEINLPEITDGSIITLEHRFNYNDQLKIADVAHTLDGEIKGIYEIFNTHKTCSENRPEPWVEIDANSLLTLVNANNEPLIINCIRCEKCDDCIEKGIEKELERKLKIRNEVERKSIKTESDSYCCLSKPIMEMLIDIICGDDPYKQWSGIYREMLPVYGERIWDGEESSPNVIGWEYANSDMEENIKIGYDNCNNCCDTYYNEDLIRDIQNMQLYKYLKDLYVWHGRPQFVFDCYACHFDKADMEDNLKRLCEDLFGCNRRENYAGRVWKASAVWRRSRWGAVVIWDSDSENDVYNIRRLNVKRCNNNIIKFNIII